MFFQTFLFSMLDAFPPILIKFPIANNSIKNHFIDFRAVGPMGISSCILFMSWLLPKSIWGGLNVQGLLKNGKIKKTLHQRKRSLLKAYANGSYSIWGQCQVYPQASWQPKKRRKTQSCHTIFTFGRKIQSP